MIDRLRQIAVLLLCGSLPGCYIPFKFSGFRPGGPGVLVESYCVAGVRDRLRIDAPHGAVIFLRAAKNGTGAPASLDIYLEVPDGVSLRLLAPEVGLDSPEWSEPRSLAISEITAPGPRHYPPLAALPGSSEESMGRFSLWLPPGGMPAVSHFNVTLPAMSINGERFQAGTVAFDAYSEWGTYTCVQ